jgi:hemerythrin superfamily protein
MRQQDAIALLKADHKAVKALFKEADALSDRATTQLKKLGDQICHELTVHTQLEEQIFYPAVKERSQRGHREERELVLESYEEHGLAKKVIGELQRADANDEAYRAKLNVLHELIDEHVKEEERALFPGAKELFDEDELVDLGGQLKAMKERLAPAAV